MYTPSASLASGPSRSAVSAALRLLRGQVSDPEPAARLWLAVIENAVRTAYAPPAGDDRLREEAQHWIDSEEFEGVARAIGLHPQWARDKIRQIPRVAEASRPHS
ncbi:MAG: hypothetical protein ACYDA8_13570 [Deferrisomatales bacterium]